MPLFLGIELGSTRIKAVVIDETGKPLASGSYDWENSLVGGIWTYSLDDAWHGVRESISNLAADYLEQKKQPLTNIAGIGISAMMHGYLVFDKDGNQLVPFRTWRNTITEHSAKLLTDTFGFNIPQRWSIAHLHHAMASGEPHINSIDYLTTLGGYVHYKITGKKVVGVGEASGIFPVDSETNDYHADMLAQFNKIAQGYNVPWELNDILPKVLSAGEDAGCLTPEGAKQLDPAGSILKPGIPLCPPEGDAGTGMVATNAISPGTGNISAGTSIFAMLVPDKMLSKPHPQIDVIATPTGKPVAMVHCNNCTADLDAWINLFYDVIKTTYKELPIGKTELYGSLYNAALSGDIDSGSLVSVNYLSGEHITGFDEGRPLFLREPDSRFTVPNFMRSLLFSAMATLRIGMNILADEGVCVSRLLGHGGLFKTPIVAQKLMAGALGTPVAVMESAGEGGAWGVALLGAYRVLKEQNETLDEFLNTRIFAGSKVTVIDPDPKDIQSFDIYLDRYMKALEVERTAVRS